MTSTQTDRPRDPLASLKIDRTEGRPHRRGPGRKRGRLWMWLVVMLLVGGGGVWAVRSGWWDISSGTLVPEMIRSRPEVRVVRAEVEQGRSADATVIATGYLESRRQAKIGARAPGRIQTMNVEEGSRVAAHDVLAILEHADLDAVLAATQASVVRAKAALAEQKIAVEHFRREFDRARKLKASSSVSELEYNRSQFDFEGAVAKLDLLTAEIALADARAAEAEQLKENMFVRAPFAGTVISKDAEVGESILPGGMGEASGRGSVVTIADLEHLEVECDVKEDFIGRIQEEQTAEVAVDAVPGRRYTGLVRKIIPMGDRARATIKVRVEIVDADGRLFPEMSGRVYFLPPQTASSALVSDKPRVFCPTAALILAEATEGEMSFLWTVDDDNRAHRRQVVTGATRDKMTEITTGLQSQERVIVDPPELLEGQLVKIVQE